MLGRTIALMHGLAGFAAAANSLPLWTKPGLLAVVAFSFHRCLQRHLRNPEVQALAMKADGRWEITGRSGRVSAVLAETSVVTRWIVILHLDSDSGKIAVPLCRDSLDPESFRRLRVALRCRVSGHGPADSG